jgi:two-component system CheB/CheR fusion protein
MAEGEDFPRLVVVGSSAGGIEALCTLASTLPSDFPAPIVVAQHLDPHRASQLEAILNQHSTLPVRTVQEQVKLETGVVYVVPANQNVEITNHEVRLRTPGTGPKPSIDLLLSSAADVFADNLIAVILTGTGSDGSAGALEVKRAGGTVVIQNPRTAPYPALPLSLAPTVVDVVANIEEVGPLLYTLLTRPATPITSEDEAAVRTVLEQLQDRFAVDFGSYKQPTILRRLQRRMAATGQESIGTYLRYLATHPDEYRYLVSAFLIKVTEFFRDPELYDYLRENVLPQVVNHARQRENEIRVWSAGCATGEEAYSLAILLAEALGEELHQFHVRVFATDLDAEAVGFARRGVYPSSAVRNVPKDLLAKYFTAQGNEYTIKKSVRALMVFGQHDLADRTPFPRIDLLVCRNVLIYFGPEMQQHVLQLFAFSLRDAGYLVLGKAETVSPLPEYFVTDNARLKIFRRRGDRAMVPAFHVKDTMRLAAVPRPQLVQPPPQGEPALGGLARDERRRSARQDEWGQALLQLPVGVAIVDRQYDIQLINGTARRFLGIYGPTIGQDFVHLAQNLPAREVRSAIEQAFRTQQPTTLEEVAVEELAEGQAYYLRIACHPYQREGGEAATDYLMIVIDDVTEQVRRRRAAEQAQEQQQHQVERMRRQVDQLMGVNQELRQANEDLTAINLELRTANEEFLVGNEELQAATEEVETLNEELQATNEELETLNEELQATVEELNATNDDLQARSVELQELAVSLEAERRASDSERARLAAILAGMGDAVLVVDSAGKAVLTNDAFRRLFENDAGEIEALDENGRPLPEEATPQARAARGESFSMEFSVTKPDGSRCYFEASGQPIGANGELEGGVLVFRDITDRSLLRLQDEFIATAGHELRTPLTVLSGYLNMLLRQKIDDERTQNYIRRASEQARRMERLIADLFDVARLQSGRLALQTSRIDVGDTVRAAVDAAQLLSDSHPIQLAPSRGRLEVEADPGRLEQVLLNLLVNAITYSPDKAPIEVRVRRSRGHAVIQVQDHGPGIPAEDLPKLFSRFYAASRPGQSGHSGLGLGLFIAGEIVSAHGGSIEVESTPGAGATFTVRLPLAGEKGETPSTDQQG